MLTFICPNEKSIILEFPNMKRLPYVYFVLFICSSMNTHSAELFGIRYNLAGSLGSELFAPPATTGLKAAITYTRADVDRITGGDGNELTTAIPGGTLSAPGLPTALSPTYAPSVVTVNASGSMDKINVLFGYITNANFADGRLAFRLDLPFIRLNSVVNARSATPTLNWPSPSLPNASIKLAAASQFDSTFRTKLASQNDASSGDVSGLGEVEIGAAWLRTVSDIKVLVGTSLVLPTGQYKPSPAPVVGLGHFYTLKPSIQATYAATDKISISGRLTAGLNSPNSDNQVRSGNWLGFEGAAGYLTSIGSIGAHWIRAQQYEDDEHNSFGASAYMTNNFGMFFSTKLSDTGTSVTLQFMKTVDSHFANAGTFTHLRVVKQF